MAQDEKPLSWNNRMSGIDPITSISNTVEKALDLANKKALTPKQSEIQQARKEKEQDDKAIDHFMQHGTDPVSVPIPENSKPNPAQQQSENCDELA